MLKIYSYFLFLSLILLCQVFALDFNFNTLDPSWSFYGEGIGNYVKDQGVSDKESLWMSTDWGESETAFYEFKDLAPGNYSVSFYVRAQDIMPGIEGTSLWNFYDGGDGQISPFTDLSGSYEWRKVQYNIKVKTNVLTIWFRLKVPGQVWIDQFKIDKINLFSDKVDIENPRELISAKSIAKTQTQVALKQKLYTFEGNESTAHDFSTQKDKSNGGIGSFEAYKFYNMPVGDWHKYDRIELDVYNPNNDFAEFFVTVADANTTNYWSQLNHKQNLAPGWNHLSLSLTQYVGERGSHRFLRPLDLTKLTKFFVIVDPDKKKEFKNKSFFIDNIYLTANPFPVPPKEVMAFDFTAVKAKKNSFTSITSQMMYNNTRGYGLKDTKFFRVQDSVFASEILRYSIGLYQGKFLIKVPNGKYHYQMILDQLGYWDAPFWSDRTLMVNGHPVFKESRNNGDDFLADLLQFEDVNILADSNPYDTYFNKIFKKIDRTVEVTNGFVEFEFSGDATGINLNTLVLWMTKDESVAKIFLEKIEARNKQEFNWMSRPILGNKKQLSKPNKEFSAAVIAPSLRLNPSVNEPVVSNELNFFSGQDETSYQIVQITRSDDIKKISWSFTDLTNSKGVKLNKNEIEINEIKYQYTSPDLNHETYLAAGKYIKPMKDNSVGLSTENNIFLWLKIQVTKETPKGVFTGTMSVTAGERSIKLPVSITILDYQLPKVDFPVGFFSIDPLPYSYFKYDSYKMLRKKFRHQAIYKLNDSGFTTFTGLPSPNIKNNGNNIELDIGELEELFKITSKLNNFKTVFSYGGQFPQELFDLNYKPAGLNEEQYQTKTSAILKGLLNKKSWPKIVHTFSDEAGGYSDQLSADIAKAKNLKKHFPYLSLGGFGAFSGKESNILNSYFEYGFYSSLSKSEINMLKENDLKWGFYGASASNLDDPRFSFGLGLYLARQNGLSHYLEWNLGAVHNYPYFDFDGREADAVMFFPSRDGNLYNSIRFELATEGIQTFRKLKLLESMIRSETGNSQILKEANSWLVNLARQHYFFSSPRFLNDKSVNFGEIQQKLNDFLRRIYSAN